MKKGKKRDTAAEFAAEFAEKIITAIENGTAPWLKPWEPGGSPLAANFKTGKEYRGMNCVFLSLSQESAGYASNLWGTFKQFKDAGGKVRKGEKGTRAVFVSYEKRTAARDAEGEIIKDADGKTVYLTSRRDRPVLSGFTVFNLDQVDGVEAPLAPEKPRESWERVPEIEAVIDKLGVNYQHRPGNRAFYRPATDTITMPERPQFKDARDYYLTALHECAHATGHANRLNRKTLKESKGAGSELYALEELRAEIASMMTGTRIGIGHKPGESAAYVESWLKALRDDPREIQRASIDAERISTYMIG